MLKPDLFLLGKNRSSAPSDADIRQAVTVPRQISAEALQTIQTVSNSVTAGLAAASLANIAISSVTNHSLQSLWGSLNTLQLTVHLPLNNVIFPFMVSYMFESLISFVTFDFLEALGEVGYGLEYEVSPTLPFNDGFDTLGYSESEPISLLGTLNFILAFLLCQVLWFFVQKLLIPPSGCTCCGIILCKNRSESRSRRSEALASRLIRFMIQAAFEFFICVGAVFYPRESARFFDWPQSSFMDQFCLHYSIQIALLVTAFTVLTIVVTIVKIRGLANDL